MRTSARERRERAYRRHLRQEMARIGEIVEQKTREALAVLDEPTPRSDHAVVLEGRIVGEKIVIEAEAEPGPKA